MDFKIKTITYVLLIFLASSITAQNNLVFNKVILLKIVRGVTETVPDGKTWKVMHANNGRGANAANVIKLNGAYQIINQMNMSTIGSLWLPAGTTVGYAEGSGTDAVSTKLLSIMEFNIEPTGSSSGTNTGSSGVGVSSDGMVFNKIVNTTFSGNYNGTQDIGSITVPAGKIWKIKNVSSYQKTIYINFLPNNNIILIGDTALMGKEYHFFNEGTYSVHFQIEQGSANPAANRVVIEAIEYNQ
jgi:hypothetical protein